MEKDYCKKCGKCCKNIAVDFEKMVMFRDGIQPLSNAFADILVKKEKRGNVTICSCKFLENNLCTSLNKPVECISYPSSPFAFLPEDCGYEGDIFLKLEHIKQKIRKLKEEILHYETLLTEDKSVQKIIDRHNAFIAKYKAYGSDDW